MTKQKKFAAFCVVWAAYLVASFLLLRWILVPKFGDVSVVIVVILGFLAWGFGFFKWGPILGNWETDKNS